MLLQLYIEHPLGLILLIILMHGAKSVSVRFNLWFIFCFVGVVVTSTPTKKKTGGSTTKTPSGSHQKEKTVKKSKHSHRKNAMREPSSSGKKSFWFNFNISFIEPSDIQTSISSCIGTY